MRRDRQPKELNGQHHEVGTVPQWKDEGTYPRPDSLNDTFWRWEFLRRRSDYRQDWVKYYRADI